jgi:acetyltransferase-like isoleucine patch superfamily enzyme
MKMILNNYLPKDSFARWLLRIIRKHPFVWLISLIRSVLATKKLSGNFWPVLVRINPGQKLKVTKHKSCQSRLTGVVSVFNWGGNSLPSSVTLAKNSNLEIKGDFEIGPNVHIDVAKNASLLLGGKNASSASGITCNSRIMVESSVSIGCDCIIAWDVFITDSDWHEVLGSNRIAPVSIGDKVWISHGVSVLKGAFIANGSIVAAKSLVAGKFEIEKSLIAGIPAKVIKSNMEWNR